MLRLTIGELCIDLSARTCAPASVRSLGLSISQCVVESGTLKTGNAPLIVTLQSLVSRGPGNVSYLCAMYVNSCFRIVATAPISLRVHAQHSVNRHAPLTLPCAGSTRGQHR